MRSDPDYVKRLLIAFQDAPDPTTDIDELKRAGFSCEDAQFYLHLRLLNDDGFIESEDGVPGMAGLTASGHEFAEAMNHSKAFEAVKRSLVTSSLSVMRDIAVATFKMELSRHGVHLGS
jgi:hypothetical protein